MTVLTKLKMEPSQRFDLEDLEVLLASTRSDEKYATRRMWANAAYVLSGFTIASGFIGQTQVEVSLADAALVNANATGDFSWFTPAVSAAPLVVTGGTGGLQAGRNFLELELYYQDGTPLQRAFWDPSANGGAGSEFTQEVDTVTETFARVVVNQSGFTGSADRIRIAIVDLSGSLTVTGILDRRDLFFRLGTPDDAEASYSWASRSEPPVTLVFSAPSLVAFQAGEAVSFSGGATATVLVGGTNNVQIVDLSGTNFGASNVVTGFSSGATAVLQSFTEASTGADKSIRNLRDMFTALMNEIRLIKGTQFWFQAGGALSLPRLLDYVNAVVTPVSTFGRSRVSWSGSALSFTDDRVSGWTTADPIAAIRIPGKSADLILTREDGQGGSASIGIPDGYVLFVEFPGSGNRTYSEAGSSPTNYRVAPRASFAASDANFILAYREGPNLIFKGVGELEPGESEEVGDTTSEEILAFIGAANDADSTPPYTAVPSVQLPQTFTTANSLTEAISTSAFNANRIAARLLEAYEEPLLVVSGAPANSRQVTGPLSSGAVLTLPLDSRAGDSAQSYTVGLGSMKVFLNGLCLEEGDDYTEIGTSGTASTTITFLDSLEVGDELSFRIATPQTLL